MKSKLGMLGIAVAASSNMSMAELYQNKRPQPKLKAARGRGNQGDHAPKQGAGGELPDHADWNANVKAKRFKGGSTKSAKAQAKKAARRAARG